MSYNRRLSQVWQYVPICIENTVHFQSNLSVTFITLFRELVDVVIKQHSDKLKHLWQELQSYRTPDQLYPDDAHRKKDDLSVCDSSVEALQPGWAQEATTGKWMVIVNSEEYTQVLRVESCL